jgi:cytochrome c biogenesis protein CcmG, thiol:disulfide interchange protein DsbE
MSNKPSRPKPRSAPSKGAPQPAAPRPRNMLWLWIALGVIVALVLVIAVVSSGDDNELSVGTVPGGVVGSDPDGTGAPGESKGEVWPVTVTGTPLAEWPRDGSDDPAVGVVAPTLSGYTFDGSPVDVDPSKGPVMLVFLAHWCPHCNREIPELLAWKASGQVPAELQVIAVTTGVDPDRDNYPPSSWIDEMGWDWPVLADSETQDAAIAMGLSSYPFVVILDTDGTVLSRWAGERGQEGIQEAVDAALA